MPSLSSVSYLCFSQFLSLFNFQGALTFAAPAAWVRSSGLATLPRPYAFRLKRSLLSLLRFRLRCFRSLVGSSGLEPPTSRLSGARSNRLSYEPFSFFPQAVSNHSVHVRPFALLPLSSGGDEGIRTPDPLRAKQVLSHLSYTPALPYSGLRPCSPSETPLRPLKIKRHYSKFAL